MFFGPFIGEFGWELFHWHGWVRKACQTWAKDRRKIAASFPGRKVLYQAADEFWPLPQSYLDLAPLANQYATIGWRNGFPGQQKWQQSLEKKFSDGRIVSEYVYEPNHIAVDTPDVEPVAETMLEEFIASLPTDTKYVIPWKYNRLEEDGVEFGIITHPDREPGRQLELIELGLEFQSLDYLTPTSDGIKALQKLLPHNQAKLIAVHPRGRELISGGNWPKAKYKKLILWLQDTFPDTTVAIYGEPGQAYFDDGVPPGCLDLINVPLDFRLDIQIAALARSRFAIGGRSGGLLAAYWVACPILKWGVHLPLHHDNDRRYNLYNSPLYTIEEEQPSVDEVRDLVNLFCAEHPAGDIEKK